MQVSCTPLAELVPYAKNSRKHSKGQVEQLVRSLMEFGWTNPVLVDAERGIIAGHGRVIAAKQIAESGGTIPHWPDTGQAPTIQLAHLSTAQRRAYVIADNQLALASEWDHDALRGELDFLSGGGYSLEVLGFSPSELQATLATPLPLDATALRQIEDAAAEGHSGESTDADFRREMADCNTRGALPIVPQYAEHHEAFVIVCDNTIDEAWLRNRLNLETPMQSYKDCKVRPANVVTVAQLRLAIGG